MMFYAVSRLAIHTDAQVLHMGALLEFRTRLLQHYPPPPPGLIEGLPPGVPAVF